MIIFFKPLNKTKMLPSHVWDNVLWNFNYQVYRLLSSLNGIINHRQKQHTILSHIFKASL